MLLFTEQYISTVQTPVSRGSYTAGAGIVKHLRLLTLNMLYCLTFAEQYDINMTSSDSESTDSDSSILYCETHVFYYVISTCILFQHVFYFNMYSVLLYTALLNAIKLIMVRL